MMDVCSLRKWVGENWRVFVQTKRLIIGEE